MITPEITPTIDAFELVWTLAALPGLWFWVGNRREAGLDSRAAATIRPRNGRYLWARFSVFLTNTFIGIELLFIALGATAMLRPAPVGGLEWSRALTTAGLIGASGVITLLAYRWRKVNTEIVRAARKRPAVVDELPPTTEQIAELADDADAAEMAEADAEERRG